MKLIALVTMLALSGTAFAHTTANSSASTQAQAASANMGNNQSTTFEGTNIPTTTHNYGTPVIYGTPSAFGFSPTNCGASSTKTVGTPWAGFSSSDTHGMFDCNTREDGKLMWQMGMHQAARLRIVCFGSDANRKSFEASGGVCPSSATAKGIPGAPVGPKIMAAPQVAKTLYGTINADGTITYRDKK